MDNSVLHRRDFMKYTGLGITGAAIPGLAMSCRGTAAAGKSKSFEPIYEKVCNTLFIDTHEHLDNESVRLKAGDTIDKNANDWTLLFSHYFNSDFKVAGINPDEFEKFFAPGLDPMQKWKLLEPYWPYLKYTGYGQNVRISLSELFGFEDLSAEVVPQLAEAYKDGIQPGFYRRIIREVSGIELCHVNRWPYLKSEMPDLLMSDLHLNNFWRVYKDEKIASEAGINVRNLDDWYAVINFWFEKYGRRAIAVKVSDAYRRDIDYKKVPASKAAPLYRKSISGTELSQEETKALEDHIFWYCIEQATDMGLPVKIHTGYYAGTGYMPLHRVGRNPGSACDLCRESPDTLFDFFHIAWPYYENMLAVAKQYPNAYMDMCWAWIVNPLAAKDFLKKFILTVPLNKIFTFGGDYKPVELIPGHARIARIGISQTLSELVEEEWIGLDEALWMVDPLMHGNARTAFRHEERKEYLGSLNWTEEPIESESLHRKVAYD